MTMCMRNAKWMWNPGKQSKVGQIFSHMRPNYYSESESSAPSYFVMQVTKVPLNYPHFANLHENGE